MHNPAGTLLAGPLQGTVYNPSLSAEAYLASRSFAPRLGEQKAHSEATAIEARTSDPDSPKDGAIWLRTDL